MWRSWPELRVELLSLSQETPADEFGTSDTPQQALPITSPGEGIEQLRPVPVVLTVNRVSGVVVLDDMTMWPVESWWDAGGRAQCAPDVARVAVFRYAPFNVVFSVDLDIYAATMH